MRILTVIAALITTIAFAKSQLLFHEFDDSYTCVTPLAAYCGGQSRRTPIIIKCSKAGVGYPSSCDHEINNHVDGVGKGSRCYESSPTAGDAGCVWDGMVHGPNGQYSLPPGGDSNPLRALSTLEPKVIPIFSIRSAGSSISDQDETGKQQPSSQTSASSSITVVALPTNHATTPTSDVDIVSTSHAPGRKTITAYHFNVHTIFHTAGTQQSKSENFTSTSFAQFVSTAPSAMTFKTTITVTASNCTCHRMKSTTSSSITRVTSTGSTQPSTTGTAMPTSYTTIEPGLNGALNKLPSKPVILLAVAGLVVVYIV